MPFLGKTPTKLLDANVNIDGGNIDGTTIGATSAAAATVTTFTSTGIDDNATSTAITIDSSQNVGVGTASPDGTFHVKDAIAQVYIQSNDGQPSQVVFGDVTDASGGMIEYTSSNEMTFKTNNLNERMRIDGSGNVGIGVTPEAWNTYTPIQVQQSSLASFTNGDARLTNNAYYSSGWKYIDSRYATQYLMDAGNGIHTWSTATSGAADGAVTWSERMRIDNSGNLALGATTASTGIDTGITRMRVVAPNSNYGVAATFVADSVGRGMIISNQSGSEYLYFGTDVLGAASNNPLKFITYGSERMRIDSSGNVGIGTTSPSSALHVDSSNDGPIFDSGGTGNTNHALLVRDSANTQLFRVNNDGNVGIGTSSITAFGGYKTLHFKNTGGDAIQLTETDGGVINQILCTDSSSGKILLGARSNHPTIFCTNDTERARIDSSGNLLVGTTSLSGHFTNGLPTATLSTGSTGGTTFARTHRASASNNATVDAFRFLDANGNLNNGYINGHLYVTVVGSSGLYSSTRMYYIQTNSNSTSNANFTLLSTAARGVDPVSSIAMVADGGSGAVKIQVTYINNSGVVTGGTSTISFIGQA